MSAQKRIEPQALDNLGKHKKLNRSDNAPLYADEIAEIKLSSHTARITFGVLSPDDSRSNPHHIINETITVVIPTPSFMSSISQMILPIVENEQLLEMLSEDYKDLSEQALSQLKQLRSSKK